MNLTIWNENDLAEWFEIELNRVRCMPETRAYLASVLRDMLSAESDLGGMSIVLAYCDARDKGGFECFRRLGDWVLWSGMMMNPVFDEHRNVHENIARLSYYKCHRILRGKWTLYEELADELPRIVDEVRETSALSFHRVDKKSHLR